MSTTPHNLPRFIPTLTEVVLASSLSSTSAHEATNTEQIVQSVMKQVDLVLELRISEEIEALVRIQVAEQLQILHARLRIELVSVVQQAVMDTLNLSSDALKPK